MHVDQMQAPFVDVCGEMPVLTNPGQHCYSCDDHELLEEALQGEQVSVPRIADTDDQSGQALNHARTWRKAFCD